MMRSSIVDWLVDAAFRCKRVSGSQAFWESKVADAGVAVQVEAAATGEPLWRCRFDVPLRLELVVIPATLMARLRDGAQVFILMRP